MTDDGWNPAGTGPSGGAAGDDGDATAVEGVDLTGAAPVVGVTGAGGGDDDRARAWADRPL